MSERQESETEEIHPLLSYRCRTSSGLRRDPGDYLIDFDVKILGENWSNDDNFPSRLIHLGDLRATLIRVCKASEEGCSLYDIFDDSQGIHDLTSSLFEPGYVDYEEPIRKLFPEAFPYQDILSIRRLTVHPIARGQRVGISALHRFITDWEGGCSLIAIQPLPLQLAPNIREYEDWDTLALETLTKNRKEATAKLENHFRGIGFSKVDSLPYMLLSPVYRQAPLQEMAVEDSLTISREDLRNMP